MVQFFSFSFLRFQINTIEIDGHGSTGIKLKKMEIVKLKNWKIEKLKNWKIENCKSENSQTPKCEKAWNWGHDSIQKLRSKNIFFWLGDNKCAATVVVCHRRGSAEECLGLHFISVRGKWTWLFHSGLNDPKLLDAAISWTKWEPQLTGYPLGGRTMPAAHMQQTHP